MRPEIGECPTCRTESLLNRQGRCVWCDTQVATPPAKRSKAKANVNRGVPVLMGDAVLEQAHELHKAGQSLRSISQELLPQTGYSSPKSLLMALSAQFRHRGWYIRPRIEATVKAHLKHGRTRDPKYRREQRRKSGEVRGVLCAGIKMGPPRKGEPCQHYAMAGSDYCRQHDPALRDVVVAAALYARAQRGGA